MALTTVPVSLSATALTLTTAAQPNITSVGTLTGLTVSGNIAGTLTTAAQTNITSVGTLSSLTVSGFAKADNYQFYQNSSASGASDAIYRKTTATLAFKTGSAERMTLDGSGNLVVTGGITTSGAVGFRTSADSNYAFIALQNSSLTHGGYMSIQGGTATGLEINASASSFSGTIFLAKQSQATTGGYLARFANSAGDKMVVETGGDVGIGTSSPAGQLQVYTSAARFQSLKGAAADLEIVSDNNTNPVALIKGTGTADLLNVLDNTTEVFTILDGGNVGIGNTSPAQSLHVGSSSSGTSSNGIRIEQNEGAFDLRVDAGEFYLYDVTDTRIPFLIDSSGRTGMGTTSPSSYYSKNLVVLTDGDGTGGMTLVSPATDDAAYICFADGTSGAAKYAGYLGYSHASTENMFLGVGGSTKMTIRSDGLTAIGGNHNPTHTLHALSTNNKAFLLDRNQSNEPASLNEFSSYYALSIKNRASGSYLNFGGGGAGAKIQATDGAGSATAKYIILQPYGGLTTIGGNVAPTAALTVIGDSGTQGSVRIVPDSSKGSEISHINYGGTGDWYIRSASTSGKVIINDNGGDVGIGTSSPLGRLHVREGSSGVSAANTNFDQLILEDDLHSGMSILSGSSSHGAIYFGDSSTNDIGQIKYRHDSNQLDFTTNSQIRMIINSNGEVGINDTPPTNNSKLSVGGAISQDPGSWAYGNLLRRLTITGPSSSATFTRTINVSTQLKFAAQGGGFMYMLHGWMSDGACGFVHFRNDGSGSQAIVDVYQHVYTAQGITVTASKGTGAMEIDFTVASAHSNTHGWYFVLWW